MWQDLQRAIAYIEANLTEPLQMTNIAAQAHCSSFHFQRAFSLLTGMTVDDDQTRLVAKMITNDNVDVQ